MAKAKVVMKERRTYECNAGVHSLKVSAYYKDPKIYGLTISGSIVVENHGLEPLNEAAIERTKEWFFKRLVVRNLSNSPECLEIWRRIEVWFREILATEPQVEPERPVQQVAHKSLWQRSLWGSLRS
ncbi:MAG TPA: hypothetical protein VMY36_03235 [Patescibacteria group bacterium]|nr:hypothetical protein [Patescibacteria group bacterium]